MKIPLSWIKELTPIPMTSEELADKLTMLGLEVDAIERKSPSFEGVVVGEVVSTAPHPDADKLQVAVVSDGSEQFQVVCGAANCRPGLKTPFARVGAKLSLDEEKPFKIKKGKIRGVESLGMLCASCELGLGESSEGIMELSDAERVGDDFAERFGDEILEVSLTPNLGHCASALGIAREVAALTGKPVTLRQGNVQEAGEPNAIELRVDSPDLCPNYTCRVIRDVTVGSSPDWLRKRLEASGVRSINNVVDVTNFVMLERGQPLHAFDGEKLAGNTIVVRCTKRGEKLATLDGEERELSEGMLVIADRNRPIAIAGVMGGANSEVSAATTTVVLEAATFEPRQVMRTSRRLGLQTESSRRFERHTDPCGVVPALERAASLIAELSGGVVAPAIIQKSSGEVASRQITLRLARVNKMLGTGLSLGEVVEILSRIECTARGKDEELLVTVPTYRADLREEIDLIEEVGRLYGYDNIDEPAPRFTVSLRPHAPLYLFQREIEERLIGAGLQQIVSCDLISPAELEWLDKEALPRERTVEVVNPGSADHSILRPSLLPGLLSTVRYNLHRQVRDLALFETGLGHFRTKEGYEEQALLGIALTGEATPHHWSQEERKADFFDMKGAVERLFEGLSISGVTFKRSILANFHPGRQAQVRVGDLTVGVVGEVHPATLRAAGVEQPVLFTELNLDDLLAHREELTQAAEPPLYPASERDWTITLAEEVEAARVLELIDECRSRLLKKVSLRAIYESEHLGKGRKNVTFRLLYRDDKKTLSDERVEAEHSRITSKVVEVLG